MLLFYLSLLDTEDNRIRFSEIYERYLDWMLKIAYYYLKNEQDARDVVQDIFLDIARGKCNIPAEDEGRLKSYLLVCIRNRVISYKKEQGRAKIVSLEKTYQTSGEDFTAKVIRSLDLKTFIKNMPPIYKNVLVLHFVYNKSAKEIASELSIPVSTAITRLRRGRAILNKKFKEGLE